MYGVKITDEDIKRVEDFYKKFSPFLGELKRIREMEIRKREDIMGNLFLIDTRVWMEILALENWNDIDEIINAIEILKIRNFKNQLVVNPFLNSLSLKKIDGTTCGNFCVYYEVKNGIPTCSINIVKPEKCKNYFCERAKLASEIKK
jgi:hypothetical protein